MWNSRDHVSYVLEVVYALKKLKNPPFKNLNDAYVGKMERIIVFTRNCELVLGKRGNQCFETVSCEVL